MMNTPAATFLVSLIAALVVNETISEKLTAPVPPKHDIVCVKDQCRPLRYSYGNGMLFVEWYFDNDVFIGWAKPCVEDCQFEFHHAIENLLMQIKPRFLDVRSGYLKGLQ